MVIDLFRSRFDLLFGRHVSILHIFFQSARHLAGLHQLVEFILSDKIAIRIVLEQFAGVILGQKCHEVDVLGGIACENTVDHLGGEPRREMVFLHGSDEIVFGDGFRNTDLEIGEVLVDVGDQDVLEDIETGFLTDVETSGEDDGRLEESFFFGGRKGLGAGVGDGNCALDLILKII